MRWRSSATVAVPCVSLCVTSPRSLRGDALAQCDGPALLRPLARARIGARALAANRQSLAMPHPAIAAEVHEPLDAHRYFAAQVTFDRELADAFAQLVHLR